MPTMSIMSTERFIHCRNLELLRNRLARTTGETECRQIVKLIEEEELKGFVSTDNHTQRRGSETPNNARKVPWSAHR